MAANHLLLDNKLLAIADVHTWSQNVFCIRNLVYFGYLHTIDRVNLQRFFSNFSTKPHILYEGAIFLRKFNIKN